MGRSEMEVLSDKLEILEVISRYTIFLNEHDWDNFPSLLTDDFRWVLPPPFNFDIKNRSEFMKYLRGLKDSYLWEFQMPHGVVFDLIEHDRAKARHTLHVTTNRSEMIGLCYDLFAREGDGKWRFARREFITTYHSDTAPPGKAYRSQPDTANPKWYKI